MKKKERTYTTKQVLSKIKKDLKKDKPTINSHLKKHLQSIVNSEFGKEYRAEAMKILMKAKRHEVADFLFTHYSDGTSVCLIGSALDFIKDRLTKDGEVNKNFGSKFGIENKL